ncbi:hypothetical protein ACS0TY_002645 [Phlomoides rotata]
MTISSKFVVGLILLASCLFHVTCLHDNHHVHDDPRTGRHREALEIIIGGGGGSSPPDYQDCPPPPPPPPCPPPPRPPAPNPFESKRIELVYPIIQKFKQKIKNDPFGITKTWVGTDICNKYKGFFCDILLDYNQTALAGVNFNGFNFDGPQLILQGFIDELPDITVFHANSNNFKGPIPKSIGQAGKTLIEILLLNNQLSGCLPCEIGLLKKATLFDASHNFLTGPIPLSFACLGQMDILNLANNQLYGPVPELVCKLPNLKNLTLSYNYFSKLGQECLKLIKKNVLDVKMNCIPGLAGQRSPDECHAFFSKAKTCTGGGSSSWMPCSVSTRRNSLETVRTASSLGSRRSYSALNPNVLL